ncbi:MAG: hypothetical protein EZS28_018794 [Streblomastix strix]|uniref:Uncharacterized protein n=1 Tax=Streblomastix strix TaxID=222440 RepID=A0A5J4VSY0_9EUKA|nr:MAG: hypothetical protein EZS28_018794 [Streblomastix strix]
MTERTLTMQCYKQIIWHENILKDQFNKVIRRVDKYTQMQSYAYHYNYRQHKENSKGRVRDRKPQKDKKTMNSKKMTFQNRLCQEKPHLDFLHINDDSQIWTNLLRGSQIPGLLNVDNGEAGFINIHPEIDEQQSEAIIYLIRFALEQIVEQFEKDFKDYQIAVGKIEQIDADRIDDSVDNDQSEIEIVYVTDEDNGLRKNVYGTQFKVVVNGEANPDINITKISINTSFHNVNGPDGLGGNGRGTQLRATINNNGNSNEQIIDNTDNAKDNQQGNDSRIERNEDLNGPNDTNLIIKEAKQQGNTISLQQEPNTLQFTLRHR